jgi:predicted membrane-bound spermidine synthase
MAHTIDQRHGSPAVAVVSGLADRPHLRLFTLSFLALFLELTIIRWVPGSVRVVAYYANLMLISSFLGIGLGAMLAECDRRLVRWFPALLAIDVIFLAVARHVLLPGSSVELRFNTAQAVGLTSYLALLGIFFLNAALFVPLGQQVGQQFRRLENLRAYAWDLGGSLAGTLMFGVFAVAHFSPQIGLAIAVALFALLFPGEARSGRTIVLLVLVLGVSVATTEWRATWSAYNHLSIRSDSESTWTMLSRAPVPPANLLTMQDPPSYMLSVNQNFYQYHRTIDLRRFTRGTPGYEQAERFRVSYLIPYAFQAAPRDVAVVGAGGGPDVESALLHGAEHVDAVEIDPAIVRLARRYSAGGVYGNPRVTLHVDDARAFFQRATPGYDLVVFGLLDSHGLFSSMANIRLDGFVYTVDGFRSAWRMLNDHGVLSLAFVTTSRPWLGGKLYRMVTEATGRPPRVYAEIAKGNMVMIVEKQPILDPPARFGGYVPWVPTAADLASPPASDDWPYLYLRERTIPSDYLLVILSLLTISVLAVLRLKPRGAGAEELHFGAMGAGFLLLEVKSIVDSSLYFGATWMVSLIVISGVLLLVLLANALAGRLRGFSRWLYAPLIGSILLVYAVPHDLILGLPFTGRVAWTALVVPLPIFFAGLVFSTTFKRTAYPSAVFGANLVGAMVGGFAEYLGMAIGSRSLVVVVMGAYLVSLAAVSVAGRPQAQRVAVNS